MKIFVLTSTSYTSLLPEFSKRFEEYWGSPFFVYVSNTSIEKWSDGVIQFLDGIEDRHIILLHEDFYLTQKVNHKLLKDLMWQAAVKDYDRISLLGNHTPERTNEVSPGFYEHKYSAEYHFSFEASIQKRDFLLDNLRYGLDPWETERRNAKTVKGMVCSSKEPAIWYQDKSRQLQIQ